MRIRSAIQKAWKSCFPRPVETRLINVLGGTTLTLGWLRDKATGHQFTLILSRGKLLRSERFRRAALTPGGILANDIKWAIAVQGPEYEHDVVAAYEQDEKLAAAGWRLWYVRAADVWQNPGRVKKDVLQFLA